MIKRGLIPKFESFGAKQCKIKDFVTNKAILLGKDNDFWNLIQPCQVEQLMPEYEVRILEVCALRYGRWDTFPCSLPFPPPLPASPSFFFSSTMSQ